MIDNGSAVNLVKLAALNPKALVDPNCCIPLSGIGRGGVLSLGTTYLTIRGIPTTFYVVKDDFPIEEDGMIGRGFLKQEEAVISYHKNALMISGDVMHPIPFVKNEEIRKETPPDVYLTKPQASHENEPDQPANTMSSLDTSEVDLPPVTTEASSQPKPGRVAITVPSRTRQVVRINLIKTNLVEGYLPRMYVNPDLFIGEGIVTNDGNTCKVMAINTADKDITFDIDPQEIIEFEQVPPEFDFDSSSDSEEGETPITDPDQRAEKLKKIIRAEHLSADALHYVDNLLEDYSDLFLLPGDPLPCTNKVVHSIPTEDDRPINTKQYRYPPTHKKFIEEQIAKYLADGVIKTSDSPSNSPLWIVPKRPDSQGRPRYRMVIDFRDLNTKTVGDAYPLPNITDILDQLGNAAYFSIFDLAWGFHQIPMDPKDSWKTAFSTPNGHYEYIRMPFGLKNAPATFQRLMDQVLRGLQNVEMLVYLDDIIIYARDLEEHDRKVRKLFDRLRDAKLTLQPDKVEFLRTEVSFLGHIVSSEGLKPNPDKISAIKDFPTPKNAKNIRQFLGLVGYYRRFIQNFSKKAKPLTDLLQKEKEFSWRPEQEESFSILRDALCHAPILKFPDFDQPFILTTDASDYGIGAVLSQEKDGFEHPVAYLSRLLQGAERNYTTTEKECLAALYAMKVFEPYLLCRRFTLVADHEPLTWMHSRKDPGQRLMRWMFKFINYNYTFKYKPGKLNCNADALSRNPPEPKPSEEEINKTLPSVKVFMIRRKKDKEDEKAEKAGSSRDPKAALPTIRPRAQSTGEPPLKRPPGRPVGAKTKKEAPPVDHSLVARRTRARIREYQEKQARLSASPIPHASTSKIKDTSKATGGKDPSLPKIVVSKEEEPNPVNLPLSMDRRSIFSSTHTEESEAEAPPIPDPQTSGLRIEPSETESEPLPAPEENMPEEEELDREIQMTTEGSGTAPGTTTCSSDYSAESTAPPSRSESPTIDTEYSGETWKTSELRQRLRKEIQHADNRLEQKLRDRWNRTGFWYFRDREEDPPPKPLPTHYSDGDKPDSEHREEMDRRLGGGDQKTKDLLLADRVKRLLQSAAEALQPGKAAELQEGEGSAGKPPGNPTHSEKESVNQNLDSNVSPSEETDGHESDTELTDEGSAIQTRGTRAISMTPTVTMGQPVAKSTPCVKTNEPKRLAFKELLEIPEEMEEDSGAVVLNFSQPALPDIPWAFPLPLRPLNQSVTTSRLPNCAIRTSTDSEDATEASPSTSRKRRANLVTSRQCLTYKRDNMVHFVSADGDLSASTTRLLQDIGAINPKAQKLKRPKIGQILVTPFKKRHIFSLVIKSKHYDQLILNDVKLALKNLRTSLEQRNITSFRISRNGDLTDPLDPGILTELLMGIFANSSISITVCYGSVSSPLPEERTDIIETLHNSLVGGHKGVNQTYQKIRERYYWTGMRNDVLNFIRRCDTCQSQKITRAKTREPMIITDTPIEAFDKVSIDTVGKLRITPDGNQHILTLQCNLTKYLIAIPIPNLRASTIADALVRHLVCQFGAPRAILSDQGTSFLSEVVESMMRLFRIHHLTTSAYHPQTNGSLERSHAPLMDFIRSYSEAYSDWDRLVPFAVFTYNTSVHGSTNFTPFELVYGRVARFPMKIPPGERLRTYNLYLQDLITRLSEMKVIAGERQIDCKVASKERYDRNLKTLNANPGDYAWVLNEPRSSKFDSYYKNPLKIVEVLTKNNVILELPNGKRVRKHTDKLKLAHVDNNLED